MKHPSMELIRRFTTLYTFVASVLPRLKHTRLITSGLVKFLVPRVLNCTEVLCTTHKIKAERLKKGDMRTSSKRKSKSFTYLTKLWSYLLRKFISPLVKNYCQVNTDTLNKPKLNNVPTERKILKVLP